MDTNCHSQYTLGNKYNKDYKIVENYKILQINIKGLKVHRQDHSHGLKETIFFRRQVFTNCQCKSMQILQNF